MEIGDARSSERKLELGCVQGSILGPKLFNLYMKDVVAHVCGYPIITYADDSYVLVKGSTIEELNINLHETISNHLEYLDKMGMITNLSKSEATIFSRHPQDQMTINISGDTFMTKQEIKVLGVIVDSRLTWSSQVACAVSKGRKLNSALKFIRNRLTKDQFLKVLTCQFYSSLLCSSCLAKWPQ